MNKNKKNKLISLLVFVLVLIKLFMPSEEGNITDNPGINDGKDISITNTLNIDGYYYTKDDVANYLMEYGELPKNFITKSRAYELGWDSDEGNLWEVTDKCSIGGDKFGNREGLLPKGVQYYECDVNYSGGYRGDDRIVYSSDGNIYFTSDHYQSFEHIGIFTPKGD